MCGHCSWVSSPMTQIIYDQQINTNLLQFKKINFLLQRVNSPSKEPVGEPPVEALLLVLRCKSIEIRLVTLETAVCTMISIKKILYKLKLSHVWKLHTDRENIRYTYKQWISLGPCSGVATRVREDSIDWHSLMRERATQLLNKKNRAYSFAFS